MRIYPCPGVYRRESTQKLQEAVCTGVPVFLGFTQSSETVGNSALSLAKLTDWTQLRSRFVNCPEDGFLEHAVEGFFANGGTQCFVMPLAGKPSGGLTALEPLLDAALLALERLTGFDLVCFPDLMSTVKETAGVARLQAKLLQHSARLGDRFVLLDSLPEADLPSVLKHCALLYERCKDLGLAEEQLSNAALYYPWLAAPKPLHSRPRRDSRVEAAPQVTWTPPCGYVAGVYARTDRATGIQKAPANEVLEGVLDVRLRLSDEDHSRLFAGTVVSDGTEPIAPGAINCIRPFAGRGIRIWGARTLSRDPQWRYVNVRRLFLSAVNWIEQNMNDIPFEPNRPDLWSRVNREVNAYCYDLFKRGALQGATTREAFYVRCDETTNTREAIDAGAIVAEVGLAAARPYEFVVVKLIRKEGGVSIAGPAWTGTA